MLKIHPTLSAAGLAHRLARDKKPDNAGEHPFQKHVPISPRSAAAAAADLGSTVHCWGQFNTGKSGVLPSEDVLDREQSGMVRCELCKADDAQTV
jgi:hypothetical protein